MSARLIPLTAHGSPVLNLQRPVLLIGRHSECDIRLDLPQVSRRHCCMAMADDRLLIRDLGSRHGVRVNGRRVDEARLLPGDEIAIGPLIYRLEDPTSRSPELPRNTAAKPPNHLENGDDAIEMVPLSDTFPKI
ncbi:MAG: FHA domain-containing protein [Isosphaeraceae bacterium]